MKGKATKIDKITMRISQEDKAALKSFAGNRSMDLGAFVRQSAFQAAEISPFLQDEDVALIEVLQEDLRKIGVNLNQITRAINGGRVVSNKAILERVDAVKQVVEFTQVKFAECLSQAARQQRAVNIDV